jgi:hypothetical protein
MSLTERRRCKAELDLWVTAEGPDTDKTHGSLLK